MQILSTILVALVALEHLYILHFIYGDVCLGNFGQENF